MIFQLTEQLEIDFMTVNQPTETELNFALPNILSLGTAEELREKFLQNLVMGSDIQVNAQNVDAITTPCLQVIIAAGNSFEEAGCQLSIENPSDVFVTAFNDLGFGDLIEKWRIK